MLIIGVTGNIASGKTTLMRYLQQLNKPTLIADEIVNTLYHEDTQLQQQLQQLNPLFIYNNQVNKTFISQIITSKPELFKQFEQKVHKAVFEWIRHYIHRNRFNLREIYIEIPLLFELRWEQYFDGIIITTTLKTNQYLRLNNRNNYSNELIDSILQKQIQPSLIQEQSSDKLFFIENNHDIDLLYHQLNSILLTIENVKPYAIKEWLMNE